MAWIKLETLNSSGRWFNTNLIGEVRDNHNLSSDILWGEEITTVKGTPDEIIEKISIAETREAHGPLR
ncbi:MAG: hypothetical protein V3V24_09845 [Nitrospinaceae bacterium]